MGKEFVNYRKSTAREDRVRFSQRVRNEGIGNVPVVVDSVDKQLSQTLSMRRNRTRIYGKEMVFHMDDTVSSVLKEMKMFMLETDNENLVVNETMVLGLEDGSIPDLHSDLGKLYKNKRNQNDKILYFLLSKETTTYGYLLSILTYLKDNVMKVLGFTNN
jgi:hypothetical protein